MKNNNKEGKVIQEEFGVVTITEENKHLLSKEELEFFETYNSKNGKRFFSKKYFRSQKKRLEENTKALFEKSPDLSPKQVLLKIMEPLPDFLPAENLVEVTKIITTTWEELSKKVAA